jgi:hypothetical protein
MNWKLIVQLSLFGLVMGIATVFVIPSTVEPVCWLVVFLISAYALARNAAGRPFVHGVSVGLANCVWVTGSHVVLFHQYAARHVHEMSTMVSWPLHRHPRVLMLLIGPVIGLISGVILGVFAVIASRLIAPTSQRATAATPV